MREIKFRVFDNDSNRMHICGDNCHDSINFLDGNNAFYYNMQNGCGSLIDPDTGKGTYELMQFTGLHDKNGEIYEGDIIDLSCEYELDRKAVVEFVDGSFVCRSIKRKWDKALLSDVLKAYESAVVIGNIYKNSELLETNSNK